MKEEILQIKQNSLEGIKKCESLDELANLKVKYLGKKGELTVVLRGMGKLSPEERPKIAAMGSRTGMLLMVDILYSMLFLKNYDVNLQQIIEVEDILKSES